jgi:tetratricopeptide (TPR) repeat protein
MSPRIQTVAEQTAPLLTRAAQLLKAGQPSAAIAPLRDAARLQPANSAIHFDLGLACLEIGWLPDSIAAFQAAVANDPRCAKAYFRMGIALEAHGNIAAAIDAYRRAAELQPSLTEAQYRAGGLLELNGRRAEAIACFRRAATSGRKSGLGRLAAARALLAEGRDPEAERILRQVLALDPTNAVAADMLGTVLADAGRFEEARDCFQRAITQAPLLAGSYYDLVRCRRITPGDEDLVTRMRAALIEPRLDIAQRLRLHLAVGKAADDLGNYEQAMQQFDAADSLRGAVLRFNPDAFAARVDRLIADFTPDVIAQARRFGNSDAAPVLIVGMPRSGTTLVEQIISSHPEVTAGGELHFWNERGALWERAGAAGTEAPFLAQSAADYLGFLREIAPEALRVTDKMPFNFLWAGLIHLALPRATIIHCRRNPIDTALSIHQTHFNPSLGFPTGGEALVAYHRTYQRLMEHWRRVLPADRFIEVDYETLTAAPEPVIRRIIASCGLPWNDACLRPECNARIVKTASKWQARQPIYPAAERWRDYEPWLRPLAALLESDR